MKRKVKEKVTCVNKVHKVISDYIIHNDISGLNSLRPKEILVYLLGSNNHYVLCHMDMYLLASSDYHKYMPKREADVFKLAKSFQNAKQYGRSVMTDEELSILAGQRFRVIIDKICKFRG